MFQSSAKKLERMYNELASKNKGSKREQNLIHEGQLSKKYNSSDFTGFETIIRFSKNFSSFTKSACYNVEPFGRILKLTDPQILKEEEADIFSNQNYSPQEQISFFYDKIFLSDIQNEDFYKKAIFPSIQSLFDSDPTKRKNTLIFTYGMKYSGKSFTINGVQQNEGILPLSLVHVYNLSKGKTKLSCSFIEIKDEQIFDLLSPTKKKIFIVEEQRKFSYPDAKEIEISSLDDLEKIYADGFEKMNIDSSNDDPNYFKSMSHTIFRVNLLDFNISLTIVDLCGIDWNLNSEQTQKGNLEQKSLINLKRCFDAMDFNTKQAKKQYVPIRDSEICKIFQEYFIQESSHILMICHILPFKEFYTQNLPILDLAARFRNINPGCSWIITKKDLSGNKEFPMTPCVSAANSKNKFINIISNEISKYENLMINKNSPLKESKEASNNKNISSSKKNSQDSPNDNFNFTFPDLDNSYENPFSEHYKSKRNEDSQSQKKSLKKNEEKIQSQNSNKSSEQNSQQILPQQISQQPNLSQNIPENEAQISLSKSSESYDSQYALTGIPKHQKKSYESSEKNKISSGADFTFQQNEKSIIEYNNNNSKIEEFKSNQKEKNNENQSKRSRSKKSSSKKIITTKIILPECEFIDTKEKAESYNENLKKYSKSKKEKDEKKEEENLSRGSKGIDNFNTQFEQLFQNSEHKEEKIKSKKNEFPSYSKKSIEGFQNFQTAPKNNMQKNIYEDSLLRKTTPVYLNNYQNNNSLNCSINPQDVTFNNINQNNMMQSNNYEQQNINMNQQQQFSQQNFDIKAFEKSLLNVPLSNTTSKKSKNSKNIFEIYKEEENINIKNDINQSEITTINMPKLGENEQQQMNLIEDKQNKNQNQPLFSPEKNQNQNLNQQNTPSEGSKNNYVKIKYSPQGSHVSSKLDSEVASRNMSINNQNNNQFISSSACQNYNIADSVFEPKCNNNFNNFSFTEQQQNWNKDNQIKNQINQSQKQSISQLKNILLETQNNQTILNNKNNNSKPQQSNINNINNNIFNNNNSNLFETDNYGISNMSQNSNIMKNNNNNNNASSKNNNYNYPSDYAECNSHESKSKTSQLSQKKSSQEEQNLEIVNNYDLKMNLQKSNQRLTLFNEKNLKDLIDKNMKKIKNKNSIGTNYAISGEQSYLNDLDEDSINSKKKFTNRKSNSNKKIKEEEQSNIQQSAIPTQNPFIQSNGIKSNKSEKEINGNYSFSFRNSFGEKLNNQNQQNQQEETAEKQEEEIKNQEKKSSKNGLSQIAQQNIIQFEKTFKTNPFLEGLNLQNNPISNDTHDLEINQKEDNKKEDSKNEEENKKEDSKKEKDSKKTEIKYNSLGYPLNSKGKAVDFLGNELPSSMNDDSQNQSQNQNLSQSQNQNSFETNKTCIFNFEKIIKEDGKEYLVIKNVQQGNIIEPSEIEKDSSLIKNDSKSLQQQSKKSSLSNNSKTKSKRKPFKNLEICTVENPLEGIETTSSNTKTSGEKTLKEFELKRMNTQQEIDFCIDPTQKDDIEMSPLELKTEQQMDLQFEGKVEENKELKLEPQSVFSSEYKVKNKGKKIKTKNVERFTIKAAYEKKDEEEVELTEENIFNITIGENEYQKIQKEEEIKSKQNKKENKKKKKGGRMNEILLEIEKLEEEKRKKEEEEEEKRKKEEEENEEENSKRNKSKEPKKKNKKEKSKKEKSKKDEENENETEINLISEEEESKKTKKNKKKKAKDVIEKINEYDEEKEEEIKNVSQEKTKKKKNKKKINIQLEDDTNDFNKEDEDEEIERCKSRGKSGNKNKKNKKAKTKNDVSDKYFDVDYEEIENIISKAEEERKKKKKTRKTKF